MNRIKAVPRTELPIPLGAAAGGSTSMSIDGEPAFRQLPHAEGAGGRLDAAASERRGAARFDLQLGVEVYGYDGQLSLIHAYGTTRNVSASGLIADVDVDLPVGSPAVIALRPSRPSLEPRILRGRVVRCNEKPDGHGLAIQFDVDARQFALDPA